MTFTHGLSVKSGKLKEQKQNQGTLHFEKGTYRVLYERNNKTAFFSEHLKFQE